MVINDICIMEDLTGYTDEEGLKLLRKHIFLALVPETKRMYAKYGLAKFIAYGYNSGFQTCVFIANFIHNILCKTNIYSMKTWQGHFKYKAPNGGRIIEDKHPYIILTDTNTDRQILIDVGRSSMKGVFHPITKGLYSELKEIGEYENVELLDSKPMNWKNMLYQDPAEFITGLQPLKFYNEMMLNCKELLIFENSEEELCDKCEDVYDKYSFLTKQKYVADGAC